MLCLKLVVAVCALLSAVNATSVPLRRLVHEFIDTQYAGEVVIDSQTFLLVFDTSSPYVIVPSLECMGGSCACVSAQKYVGSADGDGQNVTVTYFDFAQATGTVVDVSLTIVDLTSPNQGIVLATVLGPEPCRLGASGTVGLAPPPAATLSGVETVVNSFAGQQLIANVFSVHHARYPDGEHFGELVLGGSDSRYVASSFTSVPLEDQTSWQFKIDQVLIGNTNVADNNTLGLIDTSKAVILGPANQINQINQAIGCTPTAVNSETNLCVLSCDGTDNLPVFVFVIGGTNFNISAEYYVQRNGNLCYSGFVPSDVDHYLIGDFFIDHYYCEFNWKEQVMRFAVAVEDV